MQQADRAGEQQRLEDQPEISDILAAIARVQVAQDQRGDNTALNAKTTTERSVHSRPIVDHARHVIRTAPGFY
ncbi:hypothetical protein [Sphingomonas sp. NBWT7]|uniref:hypothetical protein n=1 Tax=Sphingomonas sp. NBWT7 TaxID=2596913 RepID=UPI001CA4D329|nr:hypothetical protein [Sphingomonas sp. NBWT7]